jgi:adenosyl cobinamide kinase/adenosyl cobinamide phosphate guanylyltransferase
MGRLTFITGGARSGKSSFALERASLLEGQKAFLATAQALDAEMLERIKRHRQERGPGWDTIEEPLNVAGALNGMNKKYDVVCIDCLTLWLSNLMHSGQDVQQGIDALLDALRGARDAMEVFVVSNEVGMGIVPENEMARAFRDMAGGLNRRVAGDADEVHLVVSGIGLRIK